MSHSPSITVERRQELLLATQQRVQALRGHLADQLSIDDVSTVVSEREGASSQPLLRPERGGLRGVSTTDSVSSVFDGGGSVGGSQGELSTLSVKNQKVTVVRVPVGICGGVVNSNKGVRMCIRQNCSIKKHQLLKSDAIPTEEHVVRN